MIKKREKICWTKTENNTCKKKRYGSKNKVQPKEEIHKIY